ncbi:hypothetical protein F2Q69_00024611 [Brassica cretica]|uniref:Uncharacterized protein n=1 Tax=Brassica cretica TaxID=69181 RepID=A0A8S9QQA4_BRACR|nr:hypothetical protein F2Q69_00024611 [Brassica cretica]
MKDGIKTKARPLIKPTNSRLLGRRGTSLLERRTVGSRFFLSFFPFSFRLLSSSTTTAISKAVLVDLVDVSVGFYRRRSISSTSLSVILSPSVVRHGRKQPILSLSVDLVEVTGDFSPSGWISSKETAIGLPIGDSHRGRKTVTS